MYYPEPVPLPQSVLRSGRRFEYLVPPRVRNPLGRHQATIVLLHGTGEEGYDTSYALILDSLAQTLPNVKWICPTASLAPSSTGGFAWFDVDDLSENANDDIEGLDFNAAYVMSLLANEPRGVKIGVGGFCMGAALAMYCATCFAEGKYGNGNPFTVNLNAVFGISGWLTCSKNLSSKIGVAGGARRAAALPILLCHGTGDSFVSHKFGVQAAEKLTASGFQDLSFKSFATSEHRIVRDELVEICRWLISKLSLEAVQW